ncbi:NADH dehydrogenase subunit A [Thermocladium modestius]|uniref:NADH dehydrogenase subunit A n=2 Tax=Thermocladium modestius TaxID=62609 RepID=A0A830GVU2_9CREN|nr:NADH dehydrogenase subunit A [Thermocladium modestius]
MDRRSSYAYKYSFYNPVMSAVGSIVAVVFLLAIGLLTDGVVLLLRRIFGKRKESPVKTMRFEAGNIPVGEAKSMLPMQYIGFLIMFLSVEPVIGLLLTLSFYPALPLMYFLAVSLITMLPAIYVAYRDATELAYSPQIKKAARK